MAQARSVQAMKTRKEKDEDPYWHLPYESNKQARDEPS